MATPTISLATMGSSRKKSSNKSVKNQDSTSNSSELKSGLCGSDKKLRKFWGEEHFDDAIYSVYLKKINYSINYDDINSLRCEDNSELCVTRCDQTDAVVDKQSKRTTTWYDQQQVCQISLFKDYNRLLNDLFLTSSVFSGRPDRPE